MGRTLKVDNRQIFQLAQMMSEFQRVHNELRLDALCQLEQAAKVVLTEPARCASQIRVCYKEVFSLIEADVYLINQFNPYPDYTDKADLVTKIKKTFKHHATTFGKELENQKYADACYELLFKQKKIRDEVTHPKGSQSISVTNGQLADIRKVYDSYSAFIQSMMTNVFIEAVLPIENIFAEK